MRTAFPRQGWTPYAARNSGFRGLCAPSSSPGYPWPLFLGVSYHQHLLRSAADKKKSYQQWQRASHDAFYPQQLHECCRFWSNDLQSQLSWDGKIRQDMRSGAHEGGPCLQMLSPEVFRRRWPQFSGEQRRPSDHGQSSLRRQKVLGHTKLWCCPPKRTGADCFKLLVECHCSWVQCRQFSDRFESGLKPSALGVFHIGREAAM